MGLIVIKFSLFVFGNGYFFICNLVNILMEYVRFYWDKGNNNNNGDCDEEDEWCFGIVVIVYLKLIVVVLYWE